MAFVQEGDLETRRSEWEVVLNHLYGRFFFLSFERMSQNNMFKAILNGVHERGDGGILFVKRGECAYMKPEDFKDEGVAAFVKTLLASENADKVFFAMEEHEDRTVCVRGYGRTDVIQSVTTRQSECVPTTTTTKGQK